MKRFKLRCPVQIRFILNTLTFFKLGSLSKDDVVLLLQQVVSCYYYTNECNCTKITMYSRENHKVICYAILSAYLRP